LAKSDFDTATARPNMRLSRTSAPLLSRARRARFLPHIRHANAGAGLTAGALAGSMATVLAWFLVTMVLDWREDTWRPQSSPIMRARRSRIG